MVAIAEQSIRFFGDEQAVREFDPPIRVHPCGSHVIVYTIDKDGEVLIVRVRHGREDWARDATDDAED